MERNALQSITEVRYVSHTLASTYIHILCIYACIQARMCVCVIILCAVITL
jgi:hypothetical protein